MGTRQPENTRSIAIAAHGGAGKTSLVEAMLFDNGITSRLGKVEDGNTVSDFSQEEQKRQISINTSLITMERKGRQLFVLDTPGFADFVGEMRSAVRGADSLLIAVSGVSGIEVQTDKAWETGSEFEIPTAFYISKLDRENADFGKVLNDIRSDLTATRPCRFSCPWAPRPPSREWWISSGTRPICMKPTAAASSPRATFPQSWLTKPPRQGNPSWRPSSRRTTNS
jgi:translation elongation factor EF-G